MRILHSVDHKFEIDHFPWNSILTKHTVHKKSSFPLRISSKNFFQSAGLVTFTEEIFNRTFHFLCSDMHENTPILPPCHAILSTLIMAMIVLAILLLRHKILKRNLTCIYAHVRNNCTSCSWKSPFNTTMLFYAKNIAEKKAARSRHLNGGPSLPIKKKKKMKIKRK